MTTIAFKAEDSFKKKLHYLARYKGINDSALIKLLLTSSIKEELSIVTQNGMTVAEELELLMMKEEGTTGKIYHTPEDFIRAMYEKINKK